MKQRVIVVGLDGATFDVIDPLLETGELPFLERMINRGIRARLLSTIPYATIPAWPSFMTGKNPGKHGVFDFFGVAGAERRVLDSRDIRSATLWEILSAYGKRSVVMNVPGTFPPTKIDGVVVSGMLTPAGAMFTSPPGIKAVLDRATGGYRVNSRSDLSGPELIRDVYEVAEKQKAGFLALLNQLDWDFAIVMLRATDVIAHHFWDQQDVLRECYRKMDEIAGQIACTFSDATVFLISDHGFQGQRRDFHVNKWLIDKGYMCIKKGRGTEASRWQAIARLEGRAELAETYLHPSGASRALLRVGLTGRTLRRLMPRWLWNVLRELTPRGLRAHIPATADAGYDVDWEHSRASAYQLYAMESKAIKLMNLDRPSRQRLCAELVERLKDLQDPETGQHVVRRAYLREELFSGPYVDHGPDIILDLHEGYNITNAFFADDYVTPRERVRGCHHREGVFAVCGDGIAAGRELDSDLSLLDVMPTVLHYMGVPVPADCDGRVLTQILDTGSEAYQREVRYEQMVWNERASDGSLPYGRDEQTEIEERLRSLGYL